MRHLYRICPEEYVDNFSGLGGSYQRGARWNPKGYQVMYFSFSPAVAMLEMANYLPSPRLVPKNYRLASYQVEASLVDALAEPLPKNWAAYPHPLTTQLIGERWLKSNANLCLEVPSAATPNGMESIALVNVVHPSCKALKLVELTDKLFNERAFTGLS